MKTEQQIVFASIAAERDYQNLRWPGHHHSDMEFLLFIQAYVQKAMYEATFNSNDDVVKDAMQKIGALVVAAGEENGPRFRDLNSWPIESIGEQRAKEELEKPQPLIEQIIKNPDFTKDLSLQGWKSYDTHTTVILPVRKAELRASVRRMGQRDPGFYVTYEGRVYRGVDNTLYVGDGLVLEPVFRFDSKLVLLESYPYGIIVTLEGGNKYCYSQSEVKLLPEGWPF